MGTQQDCAELCATLLADCVGTKWGRFEARRQYLHGRNNTACAIPLCCTCHLMMLTGWQRFLQGLILRWHEEHLCRQALCAEPKMVCIQLECSLRLGHKSTVRVGLSLGVVMFPEFIRDGLGVLWHQYVVEAAVVHREQTSEHGHSQAMLGPVPDLWLADDGCLPKVHCWCLQDEADVSLIW